MTSQAQQHAPEQYPVDTAVLRYRLRKEMPYFADVIYRMVPRPKEGLGTFGVDERLNWYYSETVPFDEDEQVTVLYHEISHWIRNHFGRRGQRDPQDWNACGDREINDWFPQKLKVPTLGIGSKKYGMADLGLPDGELAEWYFDRLKQWDAHYREDANAMSAGTGNCESDPKCDSQDSDPVVDKKTFDVKKRGRLHIPKCGGAAGNPGDGEDGNEKDGGASEIESEAIRRNVAEKVQAQANKDRGSVPGSLLDWADQLLNPVVPWTKLLRQFTRKASTIIAGDTTQTFTKPPRRSPPGIILPKKIARRTVCAMYIDTSGSVSDDEINQSVAEVRGALRTNLADLTVSFVDTDVYQTIHAHKGHYRAPDGLQRGGTDMRKCFEHALTLRPVPNLICVMTDGETPWPENPNRGTRTIVVLTQPEKNLRYAPIPDWVWKVIEMEGREDG